MATVVDMKTGTFVFTDTVEKVEAYFALLARVGISHPYKMFESDDAYGEVA